MIHLSGLCSGYQIPRQGSGDNATSIKCTAKRSVSLTIEVGYITRPCAFLPHQGPPPCTDER